MFHLKLHRHPSSATLPRWHGLFHIEEPSKRIVHRHRTVPYTRLKLAESIHKACMKSFGFSGEAELTAVRVIHDVEKWLENKEEVTINDIKRQAARALQRYNPRAAYEYLPLREYSVKEDEYGFVRL
jgi:hypothetical protein